MLGDNVEATVPAEKQLGDMMDDESGGHMLAQALRLLQLVSPESIKRALDGISRQETIGPILDPGAFVMTYAGRTAFQSLRENREMLQAALALRKTLEPKKEGDDDDQD